MTASLGFDEWFDSDPSGPADRWKRLPPGFDPENPDRPLDLLDVTHPDEWYDDDSDDEEDDDFFPDDEDDDFDSDDDLDD